MSFHEHYDKLLATLRFHADLAAALHLLEWDQETFLPAGALESRARQVGALAGLLHEQQTAPAFLDLVDRLASDLPRSSPAPPSMSARPNGGLIASAASTQPSSASARRSMPRRAASG